MSFFRGPFFSHVTVTGDYGGPRSFEKDQLMTILSQSKLVGQNFRYASEVVSELSTNSGDVLSGVSSLSSKRLSKISPKNKKKRTAVEPATILCKKREHLCTNLQLRWQSSSDCFFIFFSKYTFCKGLGPEMVTNLTLHSTNINTAVISRMDGYHWLPKIHPGVLPCWPPCLAVSIPCEVSRPTPSVEIPSGFRPRLQLEFSLRIDNWKRTYFLFKMVPFQGAFVHLRGN